MTEPAASSMPRTVKSSTGLIGHGGPIRSVAFSPIGARALTASDDKTARVWDLRTGRQLFVLQPNPGSVKDARFSPDGRWILAVSGNSVLIWDARDGSEVGTLVTHAAALEGAAWFRTSDRILSYGDDGATEVTTCSICVPVPDLLELASVSVTRLLTVEERQRYLH